jgi:hypothetical protein
MLALLTVAYGEHTIKKSSVFEWHRRFKEGREDTQDEPRNGQSKTQKETQMRTKYEQTVNPNCYLEVLTRLRESIRRKRPELWPNK